MSNRVARNENSFQVISRCSLAGKILFEPKKGKRFPLRFAQIWYEYKGERIAEAITDNEGKFKFERLPGLEGAIIYSLKAIIKGGKYDIRQLGGDEYIGRFPQGKGIDSSGQDPRCLEIIIEESDWLPDLMLREYILGGLKGNPQMVAREDLWEIYQEEIEEEFKKIINEIGFIKK